MEPPPPPPPPLSFLSYFLTCISRSPEHSSAGIDLSIGIHMQVVLTVLASAIIFLDLIGNAIIIHVIRNRTPMRTTMDLLIVNLAAADLIMIPVIVYLVNFFFNQFDWFGGIMGKITCRLAISLQALSVASSVYSVFAISIDRFCAIFFPLKKILTKRCIKWSIVLIWLIGISFAIPQFLVATVKVVAKKQMCVPSWKNSGMSSSDYTLLFLVFCYVVPLVTIATLYLIIGVRLWKSTAPGQHSELEIERIRVTRRKPTKMLITIVIVFALCWLPLQAAEVLWQFAPEVYWNLIPYKVNVVLPWFGIANSAINPFIYPIFCEKFRSEFRRVLCFICFKERNRKKSGVTLITGLPKSNPEKRESVHKNSKSPSSPPRKVKAVFTSSL